MTDSERNSRPKSSRRRRWEVKSKESFESSLAVEQESPDKIQIRESRGPTSSNDESNLDRSESTKSSSVAFKIVNNDHSGYSPNYGDRNMVSDKLSALLEDAKKPLKNEGTFHQSLRDSEESLINNEMQNYFQSDSSGNEPSAPPFTPQMKGNKTPKKKNPMKIKPIHAGVNIINNKITEHLKQLSEDVIAEKINGEVPSTTIPAVSVSGLLIGPSSASTLNGNVSTIYCEKLNNFVIANEEQITPQKNKPFSVINKNETQNSYALYVQTTFRTFSVLCQGVLAGITIAHCLLVFFLGQSSDIFLERNSLEHTFYVLIIFLSYICLVSAFDRCDLAGQGIFSEHGIRIPWTPFFYFISLMLTLIMLRTEDFITHFHYYPENDQSKKEDLMIWWKFMCLVRTIFTGAAWIAIVSNPHTDALNSRIAKLVGDPADTLQDFGNKIIL